MTTSPGDSEENPDRSSVPAEEERPPSPPNRGEGRPDENRNGKNRWRPILSGDGITKKTVFRASSLAVLAFFLSIWGVSRHLDNELNTRLQELDAPKTTLYSAPFQVFPGEALSPAFIRQLEPDARSTNPRVILVRENPKKGIPTQWDQLLFSRNLGYLVSISPLISGKRQPPVDHPVTLPPGFLGTLIDHDLALYRPVDLSAVSGKMKTTLLVSEDRNFYQSPALDWTGITRAFFLDLRSGSFREGGSTLTQQVVKNILLGQQKTLERKLMEVVLALKLSRERSPDQILDLYLNRTGWGTRGSQRIIGIDAASEVFFGHTAKTLNFRESATLAAILRAPNRNNPLRHPGRVLAIRNRILESLHDTGHLSVKALKNDIRTPLAIIRDLPRPPGPYFTSWAIKSSGSDFTGQTVTLTMDPVLSKKVDTILRQDLSRINRIIQKRHPDKPDLEAAIIVMDPRNGNVLALSGGTSFRLAPYNRAIMAKRQPASLFKIVPYIVALRERTNGPPHANIETVLSNAPIAITAGGRLWKPRNAEQVDDARITLEEAFTQSLNRPILHLSQILSPREMVRTARELGLDTPDANDLPLSWPLGVTPETPMQIATAYATVANGGFRITPHGILRVTDRNGQTLLSPEPIPAIARRVLSPQTAYLISDLLRRTVATGTGKSLSAWTDTAGWGGKTGTANKGRDTWFVATSPTRIVAVWAGYDDNSPTWRFGATLALPIAGAVIRAMHMTPPPPTPPPGILMNMVQTGCDQPPHLVPSLATDPIPSVLCQSTPQKTPGVLDRMGLFLRKIF